MKVHEFNEKISQLTQRTGDWFLNLEIWEAWLLVVGIVMAVMLFLFSSNREDNEDNYY